jgi:hypothetical protein
MWHFGGSVGCPLTALAGVALQCLLQPALDARVQAKLDNDSQLLQLLLREVLPRAMHLYMSGPLQVGALS